MNLFDKLKQSISTRKQTAEQEYLDLLRRADNPQEGDEVRLEQLCQTLGISFADAMAEAEVLKSIDSLQPVADSRNVTEGEWKKANKQLLDYDAETEAIAKERQQKRTDYEAIARKAEGKWSRANEAARQIEAAVYANPRLFAEQIKARIRNGEQYGSRRYWEDVKDRYLGTFSDVEVEVEYYPQGKGSGPMDKNGLVVKEWRVGVK